MRRALLLLAALLVAPITWACEPLNAPPVAACPAKFNDTLFFRLDSLPTAITVDHCGARAI